MKDLKMNFHELFQTEEQDTRTVERVKNFILGALATSEFVSGPCRSDLDKSTRIYSVHRVELNNPKFAEAARYMAETYLELFPVCSKEEATRETANV